MKILTDVSCIFLEKQVKHFSLSDEMFPVLVVSFLLLLSFFAAFRIVADSRSREMDFQRHFQNKNSGIKDS
ncbi:MAG: hypothetical protein AAGE92_06135, partial [Cyanobacteria bacterium P01_G01_bin.4]